MSHGVSSQPSRSGGLGLPKPYTQASSSSSEVTIPYLASLRRGDLITYARSLIRAFCLKATLGSQLAMQMDDRPPLHLGSYRQLRGMLGWVRPSATQRLVVAGLLQLRLDVKQKRDLEPGMKISYSKSIFSWRHGLVSLEADTPCSSA